MNLVLIPLGNKQEKWTGKHEEMGADFILHPLIHTLPEFDLSPDMVDCQRKLPSIYDNEVDWSNEGQHGGVE
jgi:hypothetical protein